MGREQSGARFAIVVQSNDLFSSTVIVVPTSLSARSMDHRPELDIDGETTHVLVEQVMAVDSARLGGLVMRLSLGQMQDIDEALRAVVDLD